MNVERTWHGDRLLERVQRAAGRADVGIGVAVAVETKIITHKVSGSLARSTHAAPLLANHAEDEGVAESGADIESTMIASFIPDGAAVEVGSWMPYACVEWIGRAHPGITQGLEMVRGVRANKIVVQAFREEGLL